eukprot:349838-Chlamydomonas_euryale.AAC.2
MRLGGVGAPPLAIERLVAKRAATNVGDGQAPLTGTGTGMHAGQPLCGSSLARACTATGVP